MIHPFEVRMRTLQGVMRQQGLFQIWSEALAFARSLVRECEKRVEIVDLLAGRREGDESDHGVLWRGTPKAGGGCVEQHVRPESRVDSKEEEVQKDFEVRTGRGKLALPNLRMAHRCACHLARRQHTIIVDLQLENLPDDDGIIWDSSEPVCARPQMWWAAQSGRGRPRRASEPVPARRVFSDWLKALLS
ncbi:hypothetical protein LZC95_19680 [Pendulispora brunnea]|uniref:Uncharacterized protein n=1 Tax=Pendulispora brunnea TaxID=2905690 RepID=A0ABZ2KKG5_9BACT